MAVAAVTTALVFLSASADVPFITPFGSFTILLIGTGNKLDGFNLPFLLPAADYAVSQALSQLGVQFNLVMKDDGTVPPAALAHCHPLDVANLLGIASRYIATVQPDFLIGPGCNADMKAVAQLAMAKNIFTVTHYSPGVGNLVRLSSGLNRVGFSLRAFVMPVLRMCVQEGWTVVSVIWYQCNPLDTTDAYNFKFELAYQAVDELMSMADQWNLSSLAINNIVHNPLDQNSNNTSDNLDKVRNTSRAVLLYVPPLQLKEYLIMAQSKGMMNGDYAIFTADPYLAMVSDMSNGYPYPMNVSDDDRPMFRQAMNMVMFHAVEQHRTDDEGRKAFTQIMRDKAKDSKYGLTNELTVENIWNMANVYDIIMMLAGSISKMTPDERKKFVGAKSPLTADRINIPAKYLYGKTIGKPDFIIASDASYYMDTYGDRQDRYYIRTIVDKTTDPINKNFTMDDFVRVFQFDSITNESMNVPNKPTISWPNGNKPNGVPACGFTNDKNKCDPNLWKQRVYWVIAAPLVMIQLWILWYFIRQYIEEKKIFSQCIANPIDLLVINPDEEYRVRKQKLNKLKNATNQLEKDVVVNLQNSVSSRTTHESYTGGHSLNHSLNSVGISGGMSQFKRRDDARSDTGFWKSSIVTVRWTHKKSVYLSKKAIREIQQVRAMQHDNLAVCMGACVEKDMALVIYQYCPRGTLQELIEREEQKFDMTMKIAFLADILHGLIHLQNSSLSCHGRLTSDNCHIDGRFVVRLSDYGLPSFFSHNKLETWVAMRSAKFSEAQLWQAPELLQPADDEAVQHSSELDVYAFGIILQEVILRSYPYSMYKQTLGYDMVCAYLRVGKLVDDKPLRPVFPDDTTGLGDPGLMELARRCWAEDPAARPKLSQIKESVRESAERMGIINSGSIMDMLMAQMDQQNSRLQAIVEERGKHILQEKLQADRIISACFPREFSEKLKHNQFISPEAVEIVTVLYVQIAHFEKIFADSTPAQLVGVLNEYNHFIDKAVGRFDCLKIDMKMDLTTVASGVPKKNGILNAREICRLALTLQYRIRELRFHNRPNESVKLQMGVHSGGCVAAVVGRLVPRYMLFGDTLDITKRMLVTGAIQRIQISSYTKDVLETFGSFRTEERGEVFVKGKGAMTTHWLTGEDGNKELKTLQTKYEASLFMDQDEA